MGRHIEFELLSCSQCHHKLMHSEAVFYGGGRYHEHCLKLIKAKEIQSLEKKAHLGTLTVAEANYLKEIQYDLDLILKPKDISYAKKDPYRFCKKTGGGLVNESARKMLTDATDEKKLKQLCEQRSLRWAWGSFNLFDKVSGELYPSSEGRVLLSPNHEELPSFPLENEKNLGTLVTRSPDAGRQLS